MKIEQLFHYGTAEKMALPLFSMSVSAGLPTAADDDIETKLDLNEYIVKHPATTFFVKVHGEDLKDAGVFSGDLLVVDESIEPKDGKIVVARVGGEMTVKIYRVIKGEIFLESQVGQLLPLKVNNLKFSVAGVVTHAIHSV
ncbi:MAG TPA: translesion error-prone DNA polymerase V autoproteolytic subunit [Patescibacteria group bacterium]|nr:translesion error-prone DNA polymerase V autoproteolytic subunit [Patescibacteria group bacterium]